MNTRRSFIKKSALSLVTLNTLYLAACKNEKPKHNLPSSDMKLNISLAQWSLNRAFFAKELDPNEFARIASQDYGIDAIEYVNQFYIEHSTDDGFWAGMKKKADDAGVKSLLIMVDDEGLLGSLDKNTRNQAIDNHKKWINAAKQLACHSIRVNAFGSGPKNDVRSALVDGLGGLAQYAQEYDINVLIENHGLYSSDGKWIAGIINEVNNKYLGTLPDFGNWCLNKEWGSTQGNECTEVYDRYQGLREFLPFAKGVSAKSYQFDKEGKETVIDYHKMLSIVRKSDFDGYIGIEYEGDELSEPDGIKHTKQLLESTWQSLS